MIKAIDLGDYFRIPADNRDLNYDKYISSGNHELAELVDYTSHNTNRLDINSMKQLLLKLELFKDEINN